MPQYVASFLANAAAVDPIVEQKLFEADDDGAARELASALVTPAFPQVRLEAVEKGRVRFITAVALLPC